MPATPAYLLDRTSPAASSFHGGLVSSSAQSPTSPASFSQQQQQQQQEQEGHQDAIWCAKWSAQHGKVVTGSLDHSLKIWDPKQPDRPTHTLRLPTSSRALAFTGLDTCESEALSNNSSQGGIVAVTLDGTLARWSWDGNLLASTTVDIGAPRHVALSPTAPHMVVGGENGVVKVLNATLGDDFGKQVMSLETQARYTMRTIYSPDGRLIGAVGDTGYVYLFDAESGALVSSFPAHAAPIRALEITNSLLITGADDKRVNIFDLRALTGSSSAGGSGEALSRGINRRGQVASLASHEGWITSLKVRNSSRSGRSGERVLASAGSDGTVRLWDLGAIGTGSSGSAPVAILRDHKEAVWAVDWAPEESPSSGVAAGSIDGVAGPSAGLSGGRLVSAGEDGIVRWWRGGGAPPS